MVHTIFVLAIGHHLTRLARWVKEPPGTHPEESRALVRSGGMTALDVEYSPPGYRHCVGDQ